MIFRVGNKIVCEDANEDVLKWCKLHLVLDNPEYIKKERMGLWTGRTPRELVLYERDGRNLIIPFGCVSALRREFTEYPFYSSICPVNGFNYRSAIDTYDYQEKAVKAFLEAKNGVIVAPCGSGKTQVGLEIIARLGVKALWLTHTQDLLNQSMTRAKTVYGSWGFGTITGGKVNIGEGITFATVQTMAKLDLSQYRDTWGCVVVDECHRCIGSPTNVMQFYKVLSSVSCRYKLGLTATPKRADGLQDSMFALLGDVVYEVPKEAVAETTCPVRVELFKTGYFPDPDKMLLADGTINYAALTEDLTNNDDRFKFVLSKIEELSCPILVLANRVDYLERMSHNYSGESVCLSGRGNSKAEKERRKSALRDLNRGDIDAIFATYQLAKEGLDVPNLRYVVFATPEKNETTVMQSAGRVGRKAEGKSIGTVIDFVDDFGMYYGWAKTRRRYYKKLGYEIVNND